MPAVMTAVAVGMQAVGMISDFIGGRAAAGAAKKAAAREAGGEAKLTRERIRQLDVEQKRTAGETIGATAASRVKVNSASPLMLLAEQAKEFGYQKKIVRETGATKAAAALQQGSDVGRTAKYQSYSNLAKGASNIFSIMGDHARYSKGKEG
jgi:hypothetical protein